MQAYMKSTMPYLGVAATPMRKALKQVFATYTLSSTEQWQQDVLYLWKHAEFREERYAALALCGDKRTREWQVPEVLPMYEHLIVTGAWWDYVDDVGIHRVGQQLLRNHPKPMKKKMLEWSKCDDLWKRRTSIICQVGAKENTDLELLYECIERAKDSKEFFLRKAIGWALRDYAWVDPKEIQRYVRANESTLSGLSKREALKNL